MHRFNLLRLYFAAAIILLGMAGMLIRYYHCLDEESAAKVSVRQGKYHLHIPLQTGTIYDRNYRPITNSEKTLYAVVNPTPDTMLSLFGKIKHSEELQDALRRVSPFACEISEEIQETQNLFLLHGATNPNENTPAQHLVGYCQDGKGVCGLEAAYSDWLSACAYSTDILFTVNGRGAVLSGGEQLRTETGTPNGGVVTTLDKRIQKIAETALRSAPSQKGAAIVMDIKTGDLLACASLPVYQISALDEAIQNTDSPFINRALCAFPVGSVFKLVTAAAALEQGFTTDYCYECTGSFSLYGQRFRCHQLNGHKLLNMQQAMTVSCNPYFISLSQLLSAETLHQFAESLGFGKPTVLAPNIVSDGGTLPDVSCLALPAEKANFSFGQGQLTASPLQIAAMTACIAYDGIYSSPRLVLGKTTDGNTLIQPEKTMQQQILKPETAKTLREMMIAVLRDSEKSNAVPCNTYAAGKTSTAQTGRKDAAGKELCHAWMTGFFPAYYPKYAVTVLIEDGGSGNDAAAPIFRRIIEEIRRIQA